MIIMINYSLEEVKNYMKTFKCGTDHGIHVFTAEDVDFFISTIDTNICPDFDYEIGATKLVIIPFDRDYVIKLPFTGQYINDWYYDFELGNYIEREEDLFEEAFQKDLSDILLENYKVYSTDGIPVYVQAKCETICDCDQETREKYASKASRDRIRKEKEKKNNYNFKSFVSGYPEWVASCLDVLGSVEKLNEFIDFINDFPAGKDLHFGNIGYLNGKAIILDYGGYWEDEHEYSHYEEEDDDPYLSY